MIFSLFVGLIALILSGVSAWYSIMGLVAIFAASVIPITIMGATLETAKIAVVLWLHAYWKETPLRLKIYLVPAVISLMIITSLGTYGFLAKAHLDQSVPSGDIQAQVSLFDEKISTERANIDTARKALTQMDSAVDQLMARTDDDKGASKASNLRRSQARERSGFLNDIQISQTKIQKLQEQRAPVASKARKVEADVGPIRYVAALIYGDKADSSNLEAAVRWVIILIVMVFDPLAIVMLLAATTSIDWSRLNKKKKKLEKLEEAKLDAKIEDELEVIHHHHNTDEEVQNKINLELSKVLVLKEAEFEVRLEQAKLDEVVRYADILDKDLAVVKAELVQKEKEQNAVEEELSELTRELENKNKHISDLEPIVQSLEGECIELLTNEQKLEAQLQALVIEYDNLLSEKNELAQTLSNDESSEIIQSYTDKLILIGNEKTVLEDNLNSTKNALTMARSELASALENAAAIESSLIQKLNSINQENTNLTSSINLLRQERDKLEDRLEESLVSIDDLKGEIITLLHDKELLEQSLLEKEDNMNLSSVETLEKIQQLSSEKDKLEDIVDASLRNTEKMRLELAKMTQEKAALSELAITSSADAAKSAEKVEELNGQLLVLIDEKTALEEAIQISIDNSSVNENKISSLSKEITTLEVERNDLNSRLLEMTDRYKNDTTELEEDIKNILSTKEEDLTDLLKIIENKESNLVSQKNNLAVLENAKYLLEQQVTEMQELINEKDAEIASLAQKSPVEVVPEQRKVKKPKLNAVADTFPLGGNASFGTTFPSDPLKGDLFLRVDYQPSKLFKWLGSRWVEMSKEITETFAFDKKYIELLISKISTGEYSVDDLSDTERNQMAEYLNAGKN
jgi:hypothetical protein